MRARGLRKGGLNLGKAAVRACLVALLGFFLSKLDLFGLQTITHSFSVDSLQAITAPFYGLDGQGPIGQPRVRVVYLDEAGLDRLKSVGWQTYPPSYANFATLLTDVLTGADRPPRAVFMDFVFLKQASSPGFADFDAAIAAATHAKAWQGWAPCLNDQLVKLACIAASGGTPVIMAGGRPGGVKAEDDALAALAHDAVLADVLSTGAYPLLGPADGFADSPAALLYAADCLAGPAQPCLRQADFDRLKRAVAAGLAGRPSIDFDAALAHLRGAMSRPLGVRWSSRPQAGPGGLDALTRALTGKPADCAQPTGWGARHPRLSADLDATARALKALTPWRPPARPNAPSGPPQCLYTLALDYGAYATGPPLDAALRASIFQDKLVLIGGHLANSNDWVKSPVHGQVPGVHLHAMALDNLIEARKSGGAYRREDTASEDATTLIETALLFALVFFSGVHRMLRNDLVHRWDLRGAQAARPKSTAGALAALYLLFLALDVWLLWFAMTMASTLHVSPVNWLGIVGALTTYWLYDSQDVIWTDLEPLITMGPLGLLIRLFRSGEDRLSVRGDRLLHHPEPVAEPPPGPPSKPRQRRRKPKETPS